MRSRMTSVALSIAIVSTGVSCGTGPEEFSPVTGVWISLADSGIMVGQLELAMVADTTGGIFGTCTKTDSEGNPVFSCVVRGEYRHPDIEFDITSTSRANYGDYTGKRVDNNTIDGDLTWLNRVGATRLKRKRHADEAG